MAFITSEDVISIYVVVLVTVEFVYVVAENLAADKWANVRHNPAMSLQSTLSGWFNIQRVRTDVPYATT